MAGKKPHTSPPPVDHIPDVFDEDVPSASIIPQVQAVRGPMQVEIEIEDITVEEPAVEQNDLPSPMPPPVAPPVLPEPEPEESNIRVPDAPLPAFFTEAPTPPPQPAAPVPLVAPDMSSFEQLVPQAFVGEAREVVAEAKQEKKGMLVTFFIIIGMILVAGGIVGLYILSTKKSDVIIVPTPEPTPIVEATPVPTPTIIVATATPSAVMDTTAPKSKIKVNVLNGTKTKGLAAKEAAQLKTAGYTIGDVGNGTAADAGTITVPTGKTDVATGIQAALTGFTFTVKEDAKATSITVVLGDPTP